MSHLHGGCHNSPNVKELAGAAEILRCHLPNSPRWFLPQADTFEAVRVNIYTLLGGLAMHLGSAQLDLLFGKFEGRATSGGGWQGGKW